MNFAERHPTLPHPDLDADGYLVDLDGTLVSGGCLLPGATELLDLLGERFVIVSNDSEHTPLQLARHFQRSNLPIPADRILLAGTSALDAIARDEPGARVMILGSRALHIYARGLGLVTGSPDVDLVLVARDRAFSFRRLHAAVNAVRLGARLYLACPDRTHPGPDGALVPEAGALIAAILACVGDVPYRTIGKPEPAMFEQGCARLGIDARKAVMIGDNPLTDAAGARRVGMRFLQVTPNDPLSLLRRHAPCTIPHRC